MELAAQCVTTMLHWPLDPHPLVSLSLQGVLSGEGGQRCFVGASALDPAEPLLRCLKVAVLVLVVCCGPSPSPTLPLLALLCSLIIVTYLSRHPVPAIKHGPSPSLFSLGARQAPMQPPPSIYWASHEPIAAPQALKP